MPVVIPQTAGTGGIKQQFHKAAGEGRGGQDYSDMTRERKAGALHQAGAPSGIRETGAMRQNGSYENGYPHIFQDTFFPVPHKTLFPPGLQD